MPPRANPYAVNPQMPITLMPIPQRLINSSGHLIRPKSASPSVKLTAILRSARLAENERRQRYNMQQQQQASDAIATRQVFQETMRNLKKEAGERNRLARKSALKAAEVKRIRDADDDAIALAIEQNAQFLQGFAYNFNTHGRSRKRSTKSKRRTRKRSTKKSVRLNKIKLIDIKKSPAAGKKLRARFQMPSGKSKHTDFGARGMSDYTKHHDKERRARYIDRHKKDLRTNDPTRAGYLSMFVLWNKPTVKGSIADYRKRLQKYNRTGKFQTQITSKNPSRKRSTKSKRPHRKRSRRHSRKLNRSGKRPYKITSERRKIAQAGIKNVAHKSLQLMREMLSNNNDPRNVFNYIYTQVWLKFYGDGACRPTRAQVTDFLEATKAYAYHYDSYLNSVLRYKLFGRHFNWIILLRHFVEIQEDIDAWRYYTPDEHTDKSKLFGVALTTLCQKIEHPFTQYRNVNRLPPNKYYAKFLEYIKELQIFLPKICRNLQIITITTDRPITLYRGLKIPVGSKLYTTMEGFSSCSTSVSTAIQIAINSGYKQDGYISLFDENHKPSDIIVMEITFPAGTKFIPNGLCTIQDESELILCQAGRLKWNREYNLSMGYWNPYLFIDEEDKIFINKPDHQFGTNAYGRPLTKPIPYRVIEYEFTKPTDIECMESVDVAEVFETPPSRTAFMRELKNIQRSSS